MEHATLQSDHFSLLSSAIQNLFRAKFLILALHVYNKYNFFTEGV
jgi:hypothetical protein